MDQLFAINFDVDIDVHEWLSQHELDQNLLSRQHQIQVARAESKVMSKIAVLKQILSVLGKVKADLEAADEEKREIKEQQMRLSDCHDKAEECERAIIEYSAQLEVLVAQITDQQSILQTLNESYDLMPYDAEFIRDEMLAISRTQTFSIRSTRDFRGRAEPPLEIRCLFSAINQFYILSKGLPMHQGSELQFFLNNDGAIIQFIKDYQFQNITSEVIFQSISLLGEYSEASYLNTNQFCHQLFQWLHFLRSFYEQNSEKLELKTEISKLSLALECSRKQASDLESEIRSLHKEQEYNEATISAIQQKLPAFEQRLAAIELQKQNLKCTYLDMIDDFTMLLDYYQKKLDMQKLYGLRSVLMANLVHSKKTEALSNALKDLAYQARESGALQHPWKSKLLCFDEFFRIVLRQGKGVFLIQDHDKIIDYWQDYLGEFDVPWEFCTSLRELEKASCGLVIFYHQPYLKRQEIEEILGRNWLKKVLYVILPEHNLDQIPQLPYQLKLSEDNLRAALTCNLNSAALIDLIKRVRKLMRSQEDFGSLAALLRNPMPELNRNSYDLSGVPVLIETYFLTKDILKQFWRFSRLHAMFRCEVSSHYFDDYEQQLGEFEKLNQKHESYQLWKEALIKRISPFVLDVISEKAIYPKVTYENKRINLNITHRQLEMIYFTFQKLDPQQSAAQFLQFVSQAVEEFRCPDKKMKFHQINDYVKDLWKMENLQSEADIKEGICSIQAKLIEDGLMIKKCDREIEYCTTAITEIELKIQDEQANKKVEMPKSTQNIEIKASDLYEVLQGRRSVTPYEWQLCSLLLKLLNVQPTILELRNQLKGQKIQRLNQNAFIDLLNDQKISSIEEILKQQKEYTTGIELKLTEFFKCAIEKYSLKKLQDEINSQQRKILELQEQLEINKEKHRNITVIQHQLQCQRITNQKSQQRADQILSILQEHSQHSEALSYILEIRNNVSRLYEISSGNIDYNYLLDVLVQMKHIDQEYLILALLPKNSQVNYRINLIDNKSYSQIKRVLYSQIIKEFLQQFDQCPDDNLHNDSMENGIQLIINDFVQSYLAQLQIEGRNLPSELIPYAEEEKIQDCKSAVWQLCSFKHFKEVEKQVKLLARITWILWQHSLTQVLDSLTLFDKSSSTYIAKIRDKQGFRAIYEKILSQMDRIGNSERCRAQLNEFLRSASQEDDLIDITIIKD